MSQQSTTPIDVSDLVQMPCGETSMSKRLRDLGWSMTDQFFSHAIYYAGNRRDGTLKRIGVTFYQPHIAPGAHTHYALPL
jgi:hypothetical protein